MTLFVNFSEHSYESLITLLTSEISDPKNFELRGTFIADYAQSKHIRDVVSHLLQCNAVKPPWDRRFALVTDELVNNSIEHGSLLGDPVDFFVRISSEEDTNITITLEVTDRWRGIHTKCAKEMEEIRTRKSEAGFEGYRENRGRGLFQIIVRLVDALYFRDDPRGGLVVGITKRLDADR